LIPRVGSIDTFHKTMVKEVAKKYGSKIQLFRGIHGKNAEEALDGEPVSVRPYSAWAATKEAAMSYRQGRIWVVLRAVFSPKEIALAPVRIPGIPDPDILMPLSRDVAHTGDELIVHQPGKKIASGKYSVVLKSRAKR